MAKIPLNDLSRFSAGERDRTCQAVTSVVKSGWYLQGPQRDGFEKSFADYLGADRCVGVASGTDALALAMLGVGCEPGDEVVTAANAGMYTTVAALGCGLIPRYADVEEQTLCPSAKTIEPALRPQTKAVVVTHLYGRVAEVELIADLCRARGLALIEDCAQSAGARRAGKMAGTFGEAAAFSFYPTKNLGAMGDAGAVVTSDEGVERRVRMLSQYGWGSKYSVAVAGGRNSRIDEIQAAVLSSRLPDLDAANERRRAVVARYTAALPQAAGYFVAAQGEDYVGHLAVMVAEDRGAVREHLAERGIATEVHYPIPDHRQLVWGGALSDVNLPVTEKAAQQIVTVPCFPGLTDSEVDRVCEALNEL